MSLTVIRFSQEASLENPADMKNFLVLRNGFGTEIRISVSGEDMAKVIQSAFTNINPEEKSIEMEFAETIEPIIEDVEETNAGVFSESNILLSSPDEDGIESL